MIKKIHKFSIIIPILNEGKNIEELAKQISKNLNKNIFEIIFVDDNSIEAVYHENQTLLGIMWHPERVNAPIELDLGLFRKHFRIN